MAKKSGGGFKRTSSTAKGTGVRRTTTYNRSTGITRSTSIKNGKNGRVTYSTGPNGQTKVTRTQKSASGYITRTTKSLNTKTKIPKFKKPKVYKPPKSPKVRATKSYSSSTRRRRRSSGNTGCMVPFLFIGFIVAIYPITTILV